MILNFRDLNPKRSAQDPTELEARLKAIEERLKNLEEANRKGPIKWGGLP